MVTKLQQKFQNDLIISFIFIYLEIIFMHQTGGRVWFDINSLKRIICLLKFK